MRTIKNIHFVGIGGSGMSGIAEVLLNQGYHVTGSDLQINAAISRLQQLGAKISLGHEAKNIGNADLVVISSAISEDNPELMTAQQARIPVLPRAQMLAELMRFHYGIAIAGTHGKTTTTSLIASILAEGGLDPTFVIGGVLNSIGANAKLGGSRYFVAEADESDASFLRLQPRIAIITNIDADHMQTYNNDFNRLRQAFLDFLHNLPFYGLAVVCIDDPIAHEILPEIARPVITYGFNITADIWADDIKHVGMTTRFNIYRKNGRVFEVNLSLPGNHNILNSLAATAVALECGIPEETICKALANFKGVGRRLQSHGELKINENKITLLDDYGHHPREIGVCLKALRHAWPNRRLVLTFQPHRFTRTKDLFDDFADVLSCADALLLMEIYPAGEKPISGIDSRSLARNIRQRGKVEPIFIENVEDLIKVLHHVLKDGDILLMQGAGNIGNAITRLKEEFSSHAS